MEKINRSKSNWISRTLFMTVPKSKVTNNPNRSEQIKSVFCDCKHFVVEKSIEIYLKVK